jgi:hypothetical protein
MRYFLLLIAGVVMSGCGAGGNPDVYRIGEHGWNGDTIYFKVFRTKEPEAHSWPSNIEVTCLSCNLITGEKRVAINDSGFAHVFIPESRELISMRLRIEGHGIDTTFIQTQRPPEQATNFFALQRPLIGRVLVEHLALLYSDSTQDSVVTSAQRGDELNIFGEQRAFFIVHHPRFSFPLYLLKTDAVRLF